MKLFERFQTLMTAAAFAEEGDRRTALELAAERAPEPERTVRDLGAGLPGDLAINAGQAK